MPKKFRKRTKLTKKPATKGKRRPGRPTKYTPEVMEKLGREMLRWFSKKQNYWLKSFAHKKGMSFQRLSEFAEKSESFSDALKLAKEIQEAKLVEMGRSKKYNAAMAIFALKNVAGWRDRQEIDHTNAGGAFGTTDNAGLRKLVTEYAKLASERKAK